MSASPIKFVKTREFRPHGCAIPPTTVDAAKAAADFRLLQVAPNVIRWRDGRTERVTERQLRKLQAAHTWAPDF